MNQFQLKKCKRVVGLSFSPDGSQAIALTSDAIDHVGAAIGFDPSTGEPRFRLELDVEQCAISRDHRRIAVAGSTEGRRGGAAPVRWGTLGTTGEEPEWNDIRDVPHREVYALEFDAPGKRLAIGSAGRKSPTAPWSHAAQIVPLDRGKPITIGEDLFVGAFAFSAEGKWLAWSGGAGGDPDIRIHDMSGKQSPVVHRPKATRTRRLVFAPDRPLLAALTGKQALLLPVGAAPSVLKGHDAQINDAAFTPDGRKLITAAHDGSVHVWNSVSGEMVAAYAWSIGKLTALAVAPDGLTALVAGDKGQMVAWDLDA